MKDKFKLFNDMRIDFDEYEQIELSSSQKALMKDRLTARLQHRKRNYKKLSFLGIPAAAAAIALIILVSSSFSGYSPVKVYASNLMEGITPQKVEKVQLKDDFFRSTADFSIDLFKNSYTKGKNSLISPTSVYLALGMAANGADGNTLKEFEKLLGRYDVNINDLNKYYYSLSKDLTGTNHGRLDIANSIWYRNDDSTNVNNAFLQANADYYNAAAYKVDFKSPNTVKDINNWVKNNTGGMIDKIVDDIDAFHLMYLINAVYFEDEWEKPFEKANDYYNDQKFILKDGSKASAEFLYSKDEKYIADGDAVGFIKPYMSGKYSFVALLPDLGVSIDSYISSLSGESFVKLLGTESKDQVHIVFPKFNAEDETELIGSLMKMGLKDCFDSKNANFNKMGSSKMGNFYISGVLHKTCIKLDENGTKAAAVTSLTLGGGAKPEIIIFDRPFVYAIIDNETKLPLFIGTMMNPSK
ncbi:MAG: serpin family protein [Bacillota bacterium]|nr:serpin family protein [Bacillota bacterium]